jgi:hypothetical protein
MRPPRYAVGRLSARPHVGAGSGEDGVSLGRGPAMHSTTHSDTFRAGYIRSEAAAACSLEDAVPGFALARVHTAAQERAAARSAGNARKVRFFLTLPRSDNRH